MFDYSVLCIFLLYNIEKHIEYMFYVYTYILVYAIWIIYYVVYVTCTQILHIIYFVWCTVYMHAYCGFGQYM